MAPSSSKMLLSWMAFWNMAVRRTIRWLGGGWGPAVGWLVEMLVEAMVEVLVEAMVEALVEALVEVMVDVLVEAMVEALVEALVEAMVMLSSASLRLRTWLDGVLQVIHPCCMQWEFLRQVPILCELINLKLNIIFVDNLNYQELITWTLR